MPDHASQKTDQKEILVVDDTPANLQLLTGILTGHGYRVRPSSDGRFALQSVAARLPDLILLDIKMPEIDGSKGESSHEKNSNNHYFRFLCIDDILGFGGRYTEEKDFVCQFLS